MAKVDAVLLRTFPYDYDPAFFYFTQLPVHFLSNNFLFLSPGKKPLLVRTVLDPEVKSKLLRVKTVKRRKQMISMLKRELHGKRIGLNMSLYPAASLKELRRELPKKRFVDVSEQLSAIRAVKSRAEIAKIAKAVKITEKALHHMPEIFRKGMTEKQLALELEFLLRKKSNDEIAFPSVVANARNSAFPHHVPGSKKIRKGILLIDCGARYKGYCADLTRVFSVGKPSQRQNLLYKTVFEAKQLAALLAVERAKAPAVFEQVSSFLKKRTGKAMIHGLGHGIGLKAHDAPAGFLAGSSDSLKAGMVLTIEPAVYLKGFGIRIEDNIVVQGSRCRQLSAAPKHLIEIR